MGSIDVQFADSTSYLQPQTDKEDCFLGGLISRHAQTRPQHPAVRAWDGALTSEKLENDTARVASRLQAECGVKPGMVVPICFEKSICAIVAELSVLKAGAGFVPIDPTQPLAWVEDIVPSDGSHSCCHVPEAGVAARILGSLADPAHLARQYFYVRPQGQRETQLHGRIHLIRTGRTGICLVYLWQHRTAERVRGSSSSIGKHVVSLRAVANSAG